MRDILPYQVFADAVLTLHFALVAFVVGGLVLVIIGNLRGWRLDLWFARRCNMVDLQINFHPVANSKINCQRKGREGKTETEEIILSIRILGWRSVGMKSADTCP